MRLLLPLFCLLTTLPAFAARVCQFELAEGITLPRTEALVLITGDVATGKTATLENLLRKIKITNTPFVYFGEDSVLTNIEGLGLTTEKFLDRLSDARWRALVARELPARSIVLLDAAPTSFVDDPNLHSGADFDFDIKPGALPALALLRNLQAFALDLRAQKKGTLVMTLWSPLLANGLTFTEYQRWVAKLTLLSLDRAE